MFRITFATADNRRGYILTDEVFEYLGTLQDMGFLIVEVI